MTGQTSNIMSHLERTAIEAAYAAAPGDELGSGKFQSAESSAALAANSFGLFLTQPALLPRLPGSICELWSPRRIALEGIVRFPWSGGRHPCLDVLIETGDALIGIESKRYEPFRPKGRIDLSEAYWRPVWGHCMEGYLKVRDHLKDRSLAFAHLDAAQLVKHALGLRTAAHRYGREAQLVYLYAEPDAWPDGRPISRELIDRHRQEISFFARRVRDDEVSFSAISYAELLSAWRGAADERVRSHAEALRNHFSSSAKSDVVPSEPLWRSDEPGSTDRP